MLCDTYQVPSAEDAGPAATELKAHPSNNRVFCDSAMRAAAASAPVFSCQQQYTLLNPQTHYPVGKQRAGREGAVYMDVATFACRLAEREVGLCPRGASRQSKDVGPCTIVKWPLLLVIYNCAGWPERSGESVSSSQSYAAAGTLACAGREFAETHVRACLHAGLRVSGVLTLSANDS